SQRSQDRLGDRAPGSSGPRLAQTVAIIASIAGVEEAGSGRRHCVSERKTTESPATAGRASNALRSGSKPACGGCCRRGWAARLARRDPGLPARPRFPEGCARSGYPICGKGRLRVATVATVAGVGRVEMRAGLSNLRKGYRLSKCEQLDAQADARLSGANLVSA